MKDAERSKIIVAIDDADLQSAIKFASLVKNDVAAIKLGLEFFCSNGVKGVQRISELGVPIFLDLKIFDIANTLDKTIGSLFKLIDGVKFLTIHALAGKEIISRCKESLLRISPKTQLIAVTILTSIDQETYQEIGFNKLLIQEKVLDLSSMAVRNGADGVVSSPLEARLIRNELGIDKTIITPGVRPIMAVKDNMIANDDQKRITTPVEAVKNGADFLVIGRPITQSNDPMAIISDINKEIEKVNL